MAALIVECLVNPGSAQQFSWLNWGEDTGNNEKNEPIPYLKESP